jgi:hypothetical protein
VSYEIRKNDIIYDERCSALLSISPRFLLLCCARRGDVSRADFTVRASLANGRFSDGWGSCDRFTPHVTFMHAS